MQSVGEGGGRVKAQLMCGKELLLLGGKQLSSVICTCHCYTGRRHGEGAGEMAAAAGEIWGEDGWGEMDPPLCNPQYNSFSPALATFHSLSNAHFEISK